jgi:group II intron reverse transcriptase/maturase
LSRAKDYVNEGYLWVVDIDLEKFFDRVNHDMLMSRVARKVLDKHLLRVIGRYLKAGILENGVVVTNEEGTPQGGPLSPLLSNILLDDLDKELESRGHKFVRYADDCNVYVRSEKAACRVLNSLTRFISGRLKLRVNEDKSATGRTGQRKFLGFCVYRKADWSAGLRLYEQRVKDFRQKVKILLKRCRGSNVEWFVRKKLNLVLRGWFNYFRIVDVGEIFRSLDSWIRHRLRVIYWRQWKKPRTRIRKLVYLGLRLPTAVKVVTRSDGPWKSSMSFSVNIAMNVRYFCNLGLFSLHQKWLEYRKAE